MFEKTNGYDAKISRNFKKELNVNKWAWQLFISCRLCRL